MAAKHRRGDPWGAKCGAPGLRDADALQVQVTCGIDQFKEVSFTRPFLADCHS
jgi:hypothetical protein